ncbi:MAG: putative Ig domain-containing protein [Planctomycetota bacterium]
MIGQGDKVAIAGTGTWAGTGRLYTGDWSSYSTTQARNLPGATLEVAATGSLDIASDLYVDDQRLSGSPISRLVNDGQLTKSSTGTVSLESYLDNTGDFGIAQGTFQLLSGAQLRGDTNVQAGATLRQMNGTTTLAASGTIDGAGRALTSGGHFNSYGSFAPETVVQLDSGVFSQQAGMSPVGSLRVYGGEFRTYGDLSITNSLDWTSGGFYGVGTGRAIVEEDATFSAHGNSHKIIGQGDAVVIRGTGTWEGTGRLILGTWTGFSVTDARNLGSAVFQIDSTGTLDIRSNVYVDDQRVSGSPLSRFHNYGQLTKSSTGTVGVEAYLDTTGDLNITAGTLQLISGAHLRGATHVQSGATLLENGGTATLDSLGTIDGAGRVVTSGGHFNSFGTFAPETIVQLDNGVFTHQTSMSPVGILRVYGGEFRTNGDLSITSSLDWTAGGFYGVGSGRAIVEEGATFQSHGNSSRYIGQGDAVVIRGTGTLSGAGRLYMGSWTGFSSTDARNLPAAVLQIDSTGTLDILSDVYIDDIRISGSPISRVINHGQLTKSSTGTVIVESYLDTMGDLDVADGTLQMRSGGHLQGATQVESGATLLETGGTATFATAATIDGAGRVHTNGGHFNSFGTFAPETIVQLDNGVFTHQTSMSPVGALRVYGGEFRTNGDLSITSSLDWTAGGFYGVGSGRAVVEEDATFHARGNSHKTIGQGDAVVIRGTGTWEGTGRLYMGNWTGFSTTNARALSAATLQVDAAGTLDIESDLYIDDVRISNSPLSRVVNHGVLVKSSGTTATSESYLENTSTGTVHAQSGTLRLSSGGYLRGLTQVDSGGTLQALGGTTTLDSTGNVAGAGRILVNSGHFDSYGTYTSEPTVFVQQGIFTARETMSPLGSLIQTGGQTRTNGDLLITNSLDWSGGGFYGIGIGRAVVDTTATMRVHGSSTKYIGQADAVVLKGTGTWESGTLQMGRSDGFTSSERSTHPGALLQIDPEGTLDITNDVFVDEARFGGTPVSQIVNHGRLIKSSAGTAIIEAYLSTDNTLEITGGVLQPRGSSRLDGLVTTQTGGTFHSLTGTNTLVSGATMDGGGRLLVTGGNMAVQGTVGMSTIELSGGKVTGDGTVNVLERLDWYRAGFYEGVGAINVGSEATMNLLGSEAKHLAQQRTLTIDGTGNWQDGSLNLGYRWTFFHDQPSAKVVVSETGVLDIQGDFDLLDYRTYNRRGQYYGLPPELINQGVVRKSAGIDTSVIYAVTTSDGVIEDQSGSLAFAKGGTISNTISVEKASDAILFAGGVMDLTDTSSVTGEGRVIVTAGRVNASGNIDVGGELLTLAGDTYLNGTLSASQMRVFGGQVHANTDIDIARVELRKGALRGTGDLSVSQGFIWSGGEMLDAGSMTVPENAFLRIETSARKDLGQARTLHLEGQALWESGAIYFGKQALGSSESAPAQMIIGMDAQLEMRGGLSMFDGRTGGGSVPTLVNNGILRRTGDDGRSVLGISLQSAGNVEVDWGILELTQDSSIGGRVDVAGGTTFEVSGGTTTLETSGAVNADGLLFVSGGQLRAEGPITSSDHVKVTGGLLDANTSFTAPLVTVEGGSLVLDADSTIEEAVLRAGKIGGVGTATITRSLDWTGGGFHGTGTTILGSSSTTEIHGSATKSVGQGRTVSLAGQTIWQDGNISMGVPDIFGTTPVEAARFEVGSGGHLHVLDNHTIFDNRVNKSTTEAPVFGIHGAVQFDVHETVTITDYQADTQRIGVDLDHPVITTYSRIDVEGGSLQVPSDSTTTAYYPIPEPPPVEEGEDPLPAPDPLPPEFFPTVEREAIFGEQLVFVSARTNAPITGSMEDLPQGAPFAINNDVYHINYESNPNYASLGLKMNGPYPLVDGLRLVEGDEGTSDAVFTITLDKVTDRSVEVGYQVTGLEAVAGEDFVSQSGTLEFAPFEASKTVAVPVIGDLNPEFYERFSVSITSVNGGTRYTPGAVATVIDNDSDLTLPDHIGRDYWVAFPGALTNTWSANAYKLLVTGKEDTTGTVQFATGGSVAFTIPVDGIAEVNLSNSNAFVSTASESTQARGVHVTASDDIAVYAVSTHSGQSAHVEVAIPTETLGTDYRAMTLPGDAGGLIAITATEDDTRVTVVPSRRLGANVSQFPINLVLDRGEVYQLVDLQGGDRDVSGSRILSDKPVAVYSGHRDAKVDPDTSQSDAAFAQLTPVETWGTEFVATPTAGTNGDTLRIMAATDGTVIAIDGVDVATIDEGQVHDVQLTAAAHITTSRPVLTAQFTDADPTAGTSSSSPSMMLITPVSQHLDSYTFAVPSGYTDHFIHVVAPADAIGSILRNGVAIDSAAFAPVGTSGFVAAQIPVSEGLHHLISSRPIGVNVYGFAANYGYAFQAGTSLAPTGVVGDIDFIPSSGVAYLGSAYEVEVSLIDLIGEALPGVPVDFVVNGANPTYGRVVSGADGVARFSYLGDQLGLDTITASVGNHATSTSVEWTPPPPTTTIGGPDSGTSYDAGETIIFSGRAVPGDPEFPIDTITINGQIVDVIDPSGNYFAPVEILPGENEYVLTVTDSRGVSSTSSVTLTGDQVVPGSGVSGRRSQNGDFVDLGSDTTGDGQSLFDFQRTSYNEQAGVVMTDISMPLDANGSRFIAIDPNDPALSAIGFDGELTDGTPYFELTPDPNDPARGIVTLSFSNPAGVPLALDTQIFASTNEFPRADSFPVFDAMAGEAYLYNVRFVDDESSSLDYRFEQAPSGMTIDAVTGQIDWTPQDGDVGTHEIVVLAEDEDGGVGRQRYVLSVDPAATATGPVFSSYPYSVSRVGTEYEYSVQLSDVGAGNIDLTVTGLPGAVVDGATIRWTPEIGDVGDIAVTVQATDANGLYATQSYLLTVDPTPSNRDPLIYSPQSIAASAGSTLAFTVDAEDLDNDPLTYELVNPPTGMEISKDGEITWTIPDNSLGIQTQTLIVSDDRGGSVEQDLEITISEPAYTVGTGQTTMDGLDVDLPDVSITTIDGEASEGDPADTAQFRITRTGTTNTDPLTVELSSSGSASVSDFAPLPDSVTIPAGENSVDIFMTALADFEAEGTENVVLAIEDSADYLVLTPGAAEATIAPDNDLPEVTIDAIDALPVEGIDEIATLRLSRSGDTSTSLPISLSTGGTATPGVDYEPLQSSITIPAGVGSVEFDVRLIDDDGEDAGETIDISIIPTPSYVVGSNSNASIDIVDDETIQATPPTFLVVGGDSVFEGQAYVLQLDTVDPVADLVTHWEVDWGDGVVDSVNGNPSVATHYYADNGDYEIVATAVKTDIRFASSPISVSVVNQAPTLTVADGFGVRIGDEFTIESIASFTETGFGVEPVTYTIDWGDGTPIDTGTAYIDSPGLPGTATAGSIDGTHTYSTPGLFDITITVTDDDGGESTGTIPVTAIDAIAEPLIQLRHVSGETFESGGYLNLASTPIGIPESVLLELTNIGGVDLELQPATVSGVGEVSISDNFVANQVVEPGASTTIELLLGAGIVSNFEQLIEFDSNVAGGSTFSLKVSGAVTEGPAWVIDDGSPNFASDGGWSHVGSSLSQAAGSMQHDHHFSAPGTGDSVAYWNLDLIPGLYHVSTTWTPDANAATDARFSIFDGLAGRTLTSVHLDQTLAPDDLSDAGVAWESLGLVEVTNGQLVVQLSDDANGAVQADAIRVVAANVLPVNVPYVDGQYTVSVLETNYEHGFVDFGETEWLEPVSRTTRIASAWTAPFASSLS